MRLSTLGAALLVAAALPAMSQDSYDAKAAVREARSNAAAMPAAPGRARPAPAPVDPWRDTVRTPAAGAPESIGSYADGCVRGAERMPLSGNGWEVMRPSRRRYYGHPLLIEYMRGLAADFAQAGLGKVVFGDIGQPRGGPTLSGHASHQTGLDVDVWYRRWPAGKTLTMRQREKLESPTLVVPDFERLNGKWDPKVIDMLRLAASRPGVDRIFVNPVIKRQVCARFAGATWVGKLRPWWGHDDHFHVRLSCPAGDALCTNPADPIPPGDSCGAPLDDWFTAESKAEARRQRTEPGKPPTMPTLPAACQAVLDAPPAGSALARSKAEAAVKTVR